MVMVWDLRPLLRLGSCTHTLVAMSQKSTLVALPGAGSEYYVMIWQQWSPLPPDTTTPALPLREMGAQAWWDLGPPSLATLYHWLEASTSLVTLRPPPPPRPPIIITCSTHGQGNTEPALPLADLWPGAGVPRHHGAPLAAAPPPRQPVLGHSLPAQPRPPPVIQTNLQDGESCCVMVCHVTCSVLSPE